MSIGVYGGEGSTSFNNVLSPVPAYEEYTPTHTYKNVEADTPIPLTLSSHVVAKWIESSTCGWVFGIPNSPRSHLSVYAAYVEKIASEHVAYLHDMRCVIIGK